jgi:electron transfer flavoprotein alpha subunit
MIGTSGKSVRPKLYIGCGISGATHHVCGMKDSGVIININSNEDAESFSVSDYKVVGNLSPIIDKLIELIEEGK